MPSVQDKVWYTMWKENSPELRQRAIMWRKQNAVTRVERPSRLLRAKTTWLQGKTGNNSSSYESWNWRNAKTKTTRWTKTKASWCYKN